MTVVEEILAIGLGADLALKRAETDKERAEIRRQFEFDLDELNDRPAIRIPREIAEWHRSKG